MVVSNIGDRAAGIETTSRIQLNLPNPVAESAVSKSATSEAQKFSKISGLSSGITFQGFRFGIVGFGAGFGCHLRRELSKMTSAVF